MLPDVFPYLNIVMERTIAQMGLMRSHVQYVSITLKFLTLSYLMSKNEFLLILVIWGLTSILILAIENLSDRSLTKFCKMVLGEGDDIRVFVNIYNCNTGFF